MAFALDDRYGPWARIGGAILVSLALFGLVAYKESERASIRRLLETGARAQGTVVSVRHTDSGRDCGDTILRVFVDLPGVGRQDVVETWDDCEVYSAAEALNKGDPIEVRYDPSDPGRRVTALAGAAIEGVGWWTLLALAVAGLSAAAIVIESRGLKRKRR